MWCLRQNFIGFNALVILNEVSTYISYLILGNSIFFGLADIVNIAVIIVAFA